MDYFLIKGHFHVVGYSPDGDSLVFEANNPKHWERILSTHQDTFQEKLAAGEGSVQLRLQGIDALETHYRPSPLPTPSGMRGKKYSKATKPKPGNYQQPAEFGLEATHKLLSLLGVRSVAWRSRFGAKYINAVDVLEGKKTILYKEKGKDRIEGYVVVNDFDRKGRPISWVFGGKSSTRDGSKLDQSDLLEIVKQSANYRLVATGLVYPYFFMTLSAKLRAPLMYGMQNARRQKRKLWSFDQSEAGLELEGFSQLCEEVLLFPYLFRRMVKHQFRCQHADYWVAVDKQKAFEANAEDLYLDRFFEHSNPYIFLIKERDFRRLDDVVAIEERKLRLLTHPGNLVFLG